MAIGVIFNTKVDERAVGGEVVRSDFFTISGVPGPGTLIYDMVEVPINVVTAPSLTNPIYVRTVDPVTHVPLGPVFTMVTAPAVPISNQFQINTTNTFLFGSIMFNQQDAGSTLEIIYTGRGSLVYAADVNNLQDEITDARGSYFSIGARLDAIVSNIVKRVDYTIGTPSGTYSGSTTQVDLPWTYVLGAGLLFVYSNGLLETKTVGYNENTTTRFTFTSPLIAGAKISVVNFE